MGVQGMEQGKRTAAAGGRKSREARGCARACTESLCSVNQRVDSFEAKKASQFGNSQNNSKFFALGVRISKVLEAD
jgi:hypothetical protein